MGELSRDRYPTDKEITSRLHTRRFKGTDSTFGKFPERLQHTLSTTLPNIYVESTLFPAYEVS